MGKTVYILGAGFSKPAGFPKQGELFADLVNKLTGFSDEQFIPLDIQASISKFLTRCGFIKDGELVLAISLEDIFTLLDQIIADRNNFVGFDWLELVKVRDNLIRGVLGLLHGCADKHIHGEEQRFKLLVANLINARIQAGQDEDPFAIISLNWDSLIEDSLFWVLDQTGGIREKPGTHEKVALADIDYCVYTTPLPNSPHTPSTKQKASKIYNIKLLKMHGSSTWLRCPCSNLVYTGLGMADPANDIYVSPRPSPFIQQHLDDREKISPAVLEPYIITPTFAKVFDLPHIQTTWHNAFIELREADEVVFIGYSLPDADYHFRALLRRAIRSTTPIKVILHKSDKQPLVSWKTLSDFTRFILSRSKTFPNAQRLDSKTVYPAQRYHQMFHIGQLTFDYEGVEGFATSIAADEQLPAALERVRKSFLAMA